ncbi:HD-GYP domain-containing protein [Rhizobium sp. YIM 134829]|uniref:HD-GYP domain-containing protein n=1 Tax=Rhizobium sp. YIM 134829 TaxID=3390453 RepID=UPI003979CBF7
MIKRIDRTQVRVGMFIETLEGEWQTTPINRRRFLLDSEALAQQIRTSGIVGAIINTSMGVDIDGLRRPDSAEAAATLQQRKETARILTQATRELEAVLGTVLSGDPLTMEGVSPLVGEVTKSVESGPAIMLDLTRLKSRDKSTFLHSVAVSALMVHFSRSLAFDAATIELMGVAGLVHDVGKLAIPITVLQKPTALTEEERRIIMSHPVLGYDILKQQNSLPDLVFDITRHHHERMDGKGYPDRIAAAELGIHVRMAAICDVYEALTSVRPYKTPWTSSMALNWMLARPEHFDIPLLWKFILSLDSTLTKDVRHH